MTRLGKLLFLYHTCNNDPVFDISEILFRKRGGRKYFTLNSHQNFFLDWTKGNFIVNF